MSEKLKQLTGKNPKDFEPVAYSLINLPDSNLFKELVDKDDYLFDFIKQNVSKRLKKVCNKNNYMNLISLLKYYSPSYEDFIISTLIEYADEDLTDKMLEIFENGTTDEKTYCAKYFSHIKDPLAIEYLNKNAFNENSYLSTNCIMTLAAFGDKELYNEAHKKLRSDDGFDQLEGAKFLVSYGDKSCIEQLINTAKVSSFSEHIASEIPYLVPIKDLLESNKTDGLYILNQIINSLGEVSSLAQVTDFEIYDIIEDLINNKIDSEIAVVLLNCSERFETLTENDEYLFDETKETKNEIYAIKELLAPMDLKNLESLSEKELNPDSLFVFSALEYTNNSSKVRELIQTPNQTLVLKAIETLKKLNSLTTNDKENALKHITNENIKNIILAL